MSRLRTNRLNLKESSSAKKSELQLRVKIQQHEFEASGDSHHVTELFEKFIQLFSAVEPAQVQLAEIPAQDDNPNLPVLHTLFEHDQRSAALIYRVPPPTTEPMANWALLLLLGYRELRKTKDVPVTVLIHALRRSSCQTPRLDRILQAYLKERFLVKGGRGKGGYYRLTSHGVEKAWEKAIELSALG